MYSFIVNPNASGGRGERIWRRLEKQLKHLGVPYEAFVTEKTGDARRLACDLTEHQREPRILIAVGGDGTVSEGRHFFLRTGDTGIYSNRIGK